MRIYLIVAAILIVGGAGYFGRDGLGGYLGFGYDGFFVDKELLARKADSPVSSVSDRVPVVKCDVVVVGGGTGGTAAAIQSARLGARTCLVEETDWLGGMITAAGVSSLDGHDWNYTGLMKEFVDLVQAEYKDDPGATSRCLAPFCYEPSVGRRVLNRMVSAERNLDVYLNRKLVQVVRRNNKIFGVVVEDEKGDRTYFSAEVTVDATELGDVLYLGNVAYDLGRDPGSNEPHAYFDEDCVQPITTVAILKDVGERAESVEKPKGYDEDKYSCFMPNSDCENSDSEFKSWSYFLKYGQFPNGKVMVNVPSHSYGNDFHAYNSVYDPLSRSEVVDLSREHTLGFVYFIQNGLGMSNYTLWNEFGTEDGLAKIPYVRESRRLLGVARVDEYDVTADLSTGETRFWPDSVAVGDYPLDIHSCKDGGRDKFLPNPPFQVPYSALVPESVDGLLGAEKNISVTHVANGRTRLQPIVMSIGQAAGAAAAIAAKDDLEPREISVEKLQRVLVQAKSRINFYRDLEPFHWAFEPVSILSQKKIIGGYDDYLFRGTRPLVRSELATLLVRSFGDAKDSYEAKGKRFGDVKSGDWYYDSAMGVSVKLDGVFGGDFEAGNELTRGEAAEWIVTQLGLVPSRNIVGMEFSDLPKSHKYHDAVLILASFDVLQGYRGRINPDGKLSRVEAAMLFYRLEELVN